jgi:ribosomal protein S18 acetylase RimI-like enzyme
MHSRIREAHAADAPSIARVHVDCWRTSYSGLVPDSLLDRLDYAERERQWSATLAQQRATTLVAEEGGQIVGFASCGPDRSGNPEYRSELYAIYVLADRQRRGFGKELFLSAARRLQDRGYESMLLWVLEQNPSRGFYDKLGGVVVGKKEERFGEAMLAEVAYGFELRKVTGRGSGRSIPS